MVARVTVRYDDDPYRLPELYDLEYADQTEDLTPYVTLARRVRGPVLELGCGTGRLTLPMARTGARVVGVDAAPEMLALLEHKLAREPWSVRTRVQAVCADFRTLALDTRFSLALAPFNLLHHCMTDADAVQALSSVRSMLAPGGQLALDCYLPAPDLYGRDPDARFEERAFTHPHTGETLQSWEQGWWDAEAHVHHVVYVYVHPDGREQRAHLRLRMWSLQELHALFSGAGFRIASEARDFEGRPARADALKWVGRLVPCQ